MSILDCPCGKRLRAGPELAGQRVRCPTCFQILEVPRAATPTVTAVRAGSAPAVQQPTTTAIQPVGTGWRGWWQRTSEHCALATTWSKSVALPKLHAFARQQPRWAAAAAGAGGGLCLLLLLWLVWPRSTPQDEQVHTQGEPPHTQQPKKPRVQKPGVDDFDEPRPAMLDAAAARALRGEVARYLLARAGDSVAPASLDGPDAAGECSRAYAALPPGPQLYRALSSHVQRAELWLEERAAESKLYGLDVLREAALCSVERARDKKLGIELCQAYLLPRLACASPDTGDKLSTANLLGTCLYVFGEAGADAERLQVYRLLLHLADDENTRDATRLRIANIFESQGNFREASRYLRGIDPEGAMGGARLLLNELEKKAENQEKRTHAK